MRRNGSLELRIPTFAWKQIGGDISADKHGGTIAEADGDHIELLKIQPVREHLGEREAKEVGHPFWTREGWYDADELDPEGDNAKEIRSALRSNGWEIRDGEIVNEYDGDVLTEDPEVRALIIAEALFDYGYRAEEGPAGWSEDIYPERVVVWSYGKPQTMGEYLADEDGEFRREVLGERYAVKVDGEQDSIHEEEGDAIEAAEEVAKLRPGVVVTVEDTFDDEVLWSSDDPQHEEREENRRRNAKMPEYRPPDYSGESAESFGVGAQEGDYFFEYGVGYSPAVYEVKRDGKLRELPFSVQHLIKEGHLGKAIEKRASDLGALAGVVFEIRGRDARQVGNVEGNRRGAKITWSPSRATNARRIRTVARRRPILAPLEPDARIRWQTKWNIGDPGAVYEFNVKFGVPGARFTDEDLIIERNHALMVFKDILQKDYKWVGDVYFSGRQGGWIAVEDETGGATDEAVLAIADRVDDARDEFVKYLKEQYG